MIDTAPKWQITTTPAITYKLQNVSGFGWARATIHEWNEGGSIDVQSDYGNFAYSWAAIGSCTLREFLCSLDFHYFMEKARPGDFRLFDPDKSIRSLRDTICRNRREFPEHFTKEYAREAWESIQQAEDNYKDYYGSQDLFLSTLRNSYNLGEIFDWDFPIAHKDNPQCRHFWDGPWQALCDYWRKELNLTREATP